MKITIHSSELQKAIGLAERVSAKNPKLPILGGILLEATKDSLIIRATNLELGIELTVAASVETPGTVAVPAQLLAATVSSITMPQEITLAANENNLSITTTQSSSSISQLPYADFPTIPQVSDKSVSVKSSDLIKGLRMVAPSASISSIKPELASVYVYQTDNQLFFVATDSFRLAEYHINAPEKMELPNLLIPLKNIAEITRFLEGGEEVSIAVTDHQISFSRKNSYLTSRLIEGVFPDYRQIIPKEASTTATVLKNDFLAALRFGSVFAGSFQQVRLNVDPKKKVLTLSAKSEAGSGTESLKAEITGEPIELSFNHKYLLDGVGAFDAESVILNLHGAGRAAILRSSKEPLLYLAMPMNR